MIKCPICPADNIPSDSKVCPGCGADLSPIQRIRELATTQYNDAVRFAELGATDSAISRLMSALTINEQFIEARKLLGKLFWKKKCFREATEQWKQALAIATDDKQIKDLLLAAQRRLKLRIIQNVTAVTLVVIILVLICFLPVYILFKSTDMRLEQVEENYGSTISQYSKLNEKVRVSEQQNSKLISNQFDDLKQEIESLKKQQESLFAALTQSTESSRGEIAAAKTRLEDLIEQIENLDAQYKDAISVLSRAIESNKGELDSTNFTLENLRQQLQHITKQQEKRASDLAQSIESGVQDTAIAIAVLQLQNKRLNESLVPLFESFRPDDAEKLPAKISELKSKLQELRRREAKYQSRNLFLIDAHNRNIVKTRLNQTEAELRSLQEEYDERVLPWQRALERIKALVDMPGSSE